MLQTPITLNSFSMLSSRAVFTLTTYWVMLAEEGITELKEVLLKSISFLKILNEYPDKF